MAKPLPPPFDKKKVVAENRRARFDYFIEERFEAGMQLTREPSTTSPTLNEPSGLPSAIWWPGEAHSWRPSASVR